MKSGERVVLEMTGMLDGLSDSDIEDISAFYASSKIKMGQASIDLVDLGSKLYYSGNFE